MKTIIEEQDYINFRKLFIERTHKCIKDDSIGLAMSGGIDSASIFFSLIELDVPFECYTFYQDGYESEDLLSSIDYCKEFNIPINIIKLPSDIDTIYSDVDKIIPFCGKKLKKTKIETLRPLKYVFENCKHKILLNGLSGDDYQPYKRKVNVAYSQGGDEFVIKSGFRRSISSQEDTMRLLSKQMAKNYNIEFIDVYEDIEIENFFLQFGLEVVLKPHKHLVTSAFKDYFDKMGGFRKHCSYQVNSKLRDFHEELLTSKYNTKNHKAIIGLYNEIANKKKTLTLF
jgi:asparagine synthetase B (glutamine-hydrolysing)